MDDGAPEWAYEKAELHEPDPRWFDIARQQCERLTELLSEWLVDGVEHAGSTSVPGLAAKPIVDVMASVTDAELVTERAGGRLAADGWCFVPPELDGRSWRRFYVKPDPSGRRRIAHLHVIQAGQPRWGEQLAFRDALRGDGELVRRYAELKRRLAKRHGHDREAYTDAKTQFVAEVLAAGDGGGSS